MLVAVFFLCAAIAAVLGTDFNYSNNVPTSRDATRSAQQVGRIYNRTAIGACLLFLLLAATRAGWSTRALRVLQAPIVWAVVYQAILAWHDLYDGNIWDLGRSTGVWALLMITMAASPQTTLDRYVPKMLTLFRLLLWISLFIGIVLPNNGSQHGYLGTGTFGIPDRLSGVAGHPNGMGAIAGIAVLLELDRFLGDHASHWLGVAHLGLAGAVLLLTQSKTALIACAIDRKSTRLNSSHANIS